MKKNPDFCIVVDVESGDEAGGFTLRDYFAGQALAGFAADFPGPSYINDVARSAYGLADAMLAERDKE